MLPNLHIHTANLADPVDAHAYREQLRAYAADPMGGATAFSSAHLEMVANDLHHMPHAHALLAHVADQSVGFATCFAGYSTF